MRSVPRRDPREEIAEAEATIHPQPDPLAPLTVADLVLKLQHEEQGLRVNIEGCDCWADAVGISIMNGELIIRRDQGVLEELPDVPSLR